MLWSLPMAGRRLDITQRQVRALCEGAKKAGYVPVLKIGAATVWLVPEDRATQDLKPEAVDDELKGVRL
jgi:hypothetical protein